MTRALTDQQIMLERIEEASRPGTPVAFRRRVLAECAAFIRSGEAASPEGGPSGELEEPKPSPLTTQAEPSAADLAWLRWAAGLSLMPTPLTYEARLAVSGEGPRASDWSDKPHRLVYDLCRHIEEQAALTTSTHPRIEGEGS